MNCPKCGSEMYNAPGMEFGFETCQKCDSEQYEKLEHQQRLDKVLKKMKLVSPGLLQIELEHTQYSGTDERILINYNALNKLFYFTTHVVLNIGCNNEKIVNVEYLISLDTVEHLIADMEAK